MAIPKHDELRIPAMVQLKEKGVLRVKDFVDPLAKQFNLTEDEVNQMYDSGNGPIFKDRISWALSYLNMAGLADKPKRGSYELNSKGIELLKTPEKIDEFIQIELDKRDAIKKSKKEQEEEVISNPNSDSTPQEELDRSFKNIRKSVYNEIIETILSKTPYVFEGIVVALLQKMGYGGEIHNSGLVTQASNDGGIDGIIKEDVLGLGRIHIQAKRFARNISIGREEIQKFVGALAVAQSNKGVFITTSYYTKGAIQYADNLNGATTVVLIDGQKLAEYMYDFGLGMQVEQTIELKKLDADFWDSKKDND